MYKRAIKLSALVCGVWLSVGASQVRAQDQAQTGQALAKRMVCMGCHQVDSKRVGPPLRVVAERYAAAGQEDAMTEYLANKIRSGSGRVWGAVPMPAQSHVTEENARALARWILSLAPAKSD